MGYDTFGLRIGIEGEKDFKNALRDINQSFKVLGSEMQLFQASLTNRINPLRLSQHETRF